MVSLHIDEQRGWRGGEQQAAYLIAGLTAQGHTVLVAGRPGSPFVERHRDMAGVTCVEAPFVGEADPVTAWRLARAARRHRVDIIHAHTSHAHSYACWVRMLARRGRVVVSRRVDFAPSDNPFTRWKYAQPDRYLTVSGCIAEVLRAYGVAPDRIQVVYSSQDPSRLEAEPIDRAALGIADLQPEDPLLLCPAALVGHKDHATLIAAMPDVLAAHPRARLLLAGEGALRSQIEGQARALGVDERVHLLGRRDDVPALLRTADLFVLSSQMEGLGGAIVEAMFAGLPVVACGAGGIPEVVVDGETGLLAPPRDPGTLARRIVQLLDDPALARRLAVAAKERAHERFTADRMTAATLDAYAELLRAPYQ